MNSHDSNVFVITGIVTTRCRDGKIEDGKIENGEKMRKEESVEIFLSPN